MYVYERKNETQGYDGGAFFSPDGSKLIFRASRPKTESEKAKYKELLDFNLVSPTEMELFVINVDGTNQRQVTDLGGANWAPYYHPDGKRIIFSSNHNATKGSFKFNLYMVNENGTGKTQITYGKVFDAFPMFSYDGKKLIFASQRNQTKPHETNLFIADWVEHTGKNTNSAERKIPNHTVALTLGILIYVYGSLNSE